MSPGGTLKSLGWWCTTGTPELLAYTKYYTKPLKSLPILESLFSSFLPKVTLSLLFSKFRFADVIFWTLTPSLPGLDRKFQPIDQFPGKWYPILDSNCLIFIPYPRLNYLKTIPFTVAHTYLPILSQSPAFALWQVYYIAHIWQYPPPPPHPKPFLLPKIIHIAAIEKLLLFWIYTQPPPLIYIGN